MDGGFGMTPPAAMSGNSSGSMAGGDMMQSQNQNPLAIVPAQQQMGDWNNMGNPAAMNNMAGDDGAWNGMAGMGDSCGSGQGDAWGTGKGDGWGCAKGGKCGKDSWDGGKDGWELEKVMVGDALKVESVEKIVGMA